MATPILIAGIGVSGEQASLLALSKGFDVHISDSGSGEGLSRRLKNLTSKGCTLTTAEEINFKTFELAVISPGIDPRSAFGNSVFSLDCPVISEIEFAARFCQTPIIGITGTNGKTTTTEVMCHSLLKVGKRTVAAGNIS